MKQMLVKVKPNSPETKIVSENGAELVIAVHAPAENNKANIELIKFLSKKFGADVRIVRGLRGRNKIVEVR
ncbi:MAG: YggU family protein [DPANN group archaeon]|nr:YggU family protein [DPANN group archaeon]